MESIAESNEETFSKLQSKHPLGPPDTEIT